MKILKYILGFIGILLLIFFVRGLLTPSISYEAEIEVNKSAAESWSVMSDEEYLPEWLEGYIRSELVSGTANTIGAVSNIYVEDNGKEMVMKETMTGIELYKLMAMHFSIDFMEMDYEMMFEEANGKTKIKTKTTTMGNGLFAKSLMPFIKGTMVTQEVNNLNALQRIINANTKNYFPEIASELD